MANVTSSVDLDAIAVENFQKYLRIPTVHPNINYDGCVQFLEDYAKNLNLELSVIRCLPDKPVVVITLLGANPHLPSILLNSHMDVVPVDEENWTHAPFAAEIDEDGNIFARGAQDTKCLGIQYLEAIRRLILDDAVLNRTIHVSFVPDEEIGGKEGMKLFVLSPEFKNLNVGFALDEGAPSTKEEFFVFNSEKYGWKFAIHCPGTPGHGCFMFDNTPGEKVRYVLNKFYELREKSMARFKEFSDYGDIITVNLTMMQGGVQNNIIPSEFVIVLDTRIPPMVDEQEWEGTITKWCQEAGEDVWIEYYLKESVTPITKLDSNIFWEAFKKTIGGKGELKVQTMPGCTDARYLRQQGIPVLGFSPNNGTPIRAHADDEFLNVQVFLKGIVTYYDILQAMANV
ncbi:lantern aminoacylase [Photinus pyralis]|uniref:N-acyl-aliphatic-L-amino acid amidohydrolase n=2 Tax=Photinus pyralis TaxID=7054 RepID=A0A1Y1L4G7_PHOPY|nr:aminoacylase-1-like isoform X2 [Photinus pyralis]KAB0802077.1 lantern aminoacylase [Photinus pyralis]